jgi:hypothetical protein
MRTHEGLEFCMEIAVAARVVKRRILGTRQLQVTSLRLEGVMLGDRCI